MRPVDADKFQKVLKSMRRKYVKHNEMSKAYEIDAIMYLLSIEHTLNYLPSHEHWIITYKCSRGAEAICSHCGYPTKLNSATNNETCPFCGSIMDGKIESLYYKGD